MKGTPGDTFSSFKVYPLLPTGERPLIVRPTERDGGRTE